MGAVWCGSVLNRRIIFYALLLCTYVNITRSNFNYIVLVDFIYCLVNSVTHTSSIGQNLLIFVVYA